MRVREIDQGVFGEFFFPLLLSRGKNRLLRIRYGQKREKKTLGRIGIIQKKK